MVDWAEAINSLCTLVIFNGRKGDPSEESSPIAITGVKQHKLGTIEEGERRRKRHLDWIVSNYTSSTFIQRPVCALTCINACIIATLLDIGRKDAYHSISEGDDGLKSNVCLYHSATGQTPSHSQASVHHPPRQSLGICIVNHKNLKFLICMQFIFFDVRSSPGILTYHIAPIMGNLRRQGLCSHVAFLPL